ncbi:transcriptional regulator [Devosia algicola]|uniref:Transcriptional regulator n=1 Tax=Devosia algicola TaxID=3026418 RepID=A0ABY7YJZ5_9HYPH|nr:transcriptional regulator [Devosia algicola]WDR01625.1 transcriptional regulator [Devosia algicola]
MTKSAFDKIAAGMGDALAYAAGEADAAQFNVYIPAQVDVKKIRGRLKMTQPVFAKKFGFSLGRVRDWEQGRFPVDAPSRVLLTIIEKEPEAVVRALSAA